MASVTPWRAEVRRRPARSSAGRRSGASAWGSCRSAGGGGSRTRRPGRPPSRSVSRRGRWCSSAVAAVRSSARGRGRGGRRAARGRWCRASARSGTSVEVVERRRRSAGGGTVGALGHDGEGEGEAVLVEADVADVGCADDRRARPSRSSAGHAYERHRGGLAVAVVAVLVRRCRRAAVKPVVVERRRPIGLAEHRRAWRCCRRRRR